MADIRRLSAYDRSIKGHRPDNLAIVVRFSPDARPFICVCQPTVRCPRPLGSRPNVGRLLPDSVPITKNRRTTGENNITWHLRQKMISLRENSQIGHNIGRWSIDSRLICPLLASQTSAACWFGKCDCVTRTKTFD